MKQNTAKVPEDTASLNTQLDPKRFKMQIEGKNTDLYYLKNKNGVTAALTNYGARLVSLEVPDKDGKMTDVVLGFDNIQSYINAAEPYFGATIGRYGNRIANGRFSLDGKAYAVNVNNGPNTLHGGKGGFNTRVWDAAKTDSSTIEFSYLSRDGEEGIDISKEL